MKHTPLYHDNPVLQGAYYDLAHYLIGEESARAAFKSDTGLDLGALAHRSPLDRLVDEATGHEKKVIAEFLDWVTVNWWGEDERG